MADKVERWGKTYMPITKSWAIKKEAGRTGFLGLTPDEDEADYIIAALNNLESINPSNPMAVAEGLGDMRDALLAVKQWRDDPEMRVEDIRHLLDKALAAITKPATGDKK